MTSKFDNGGLFRNFHAQTFECNGILCRNCAFGTPEKCGAVMLRAFMARLAGASEVSFRTAIDDETLIEFIRNTPAVKKESEHT